jgi:menaquinone-dependent protoporphyrinogen IX oxidase
VKRKVLVAIAARAGSTGQVAPPIGEWPCAAGVQADVQGVERGLPTPGQDAVVHGNPIRDSAGLPKMREFIAVYRDALARVPLAIFTLQMQAPDALPQ